MTVRAPAAVAAVAVGIAALAALVLGGGAASPATPDRLVVYAAASLRGPLERVQAAYRAGHPGVEIVLSLDSSAALRTQIEQGAPADVFLSADTVNPGRLTDAGLTAGAPVAFAGTALAIVTPADDAATVLTPGDLARPGIRVIGAGDEVPITRYALEVVENLGIEAGYHANIVSREDNVKAALAKIELGEGDAAIVYATDAMASTRVRTIPIPPDASVVATYAGVVLAGSRRLAEAHRFLGWLQGPDGQAILAEFGFSAPP